MRSFALVVVTAVVTVGTATAQLPAPYPATSLTPGGGVVGEPLRVWVGPGDDEQPQPAFTQDDVLDMLFGGNLRVEVGFEYLRPVRTFRDNGLVLPPAAASSFPTGAQLGELGHGFAFIPRFGLEYKISDEAFGVAASGKMFTLKGDERRTVSSPAGSAVLNAEDNISVGIANFLEGVARFNLDPDGSRRENLLHSPAAIASFGARYSYVGQNLNTTLVSGPNVLSLASTQDFNGFGITGSLGGLCSVGQRGLGVYGFSRGSVLAGRNNRSSTFSVVVPGVGAASTADQITDQRTILIPVGEFEVGVSWMKPVRLRPVVEPRFIPLTWFRAGMATQVWGDLGLLESPTVRLFSPDRPLILYGFTVSAGVTY
ncbi:MAG TPA: Lpg1974 family pore-forming outer membrane protein [Gemmataceae bacterium]|nr:Lpg1974 family pore-forming outer membrane protein [Gemmataceae bacterium]